MGTLSIMGLILVLKLADSAILDFCYNILQVIAGCGEGMQSAEGFPVCHCSNSVCVLM